MHKRIFPSSAGKIPEIAIEPTSLLDKLPKISFKFKETMIKKNIPFSFFE